MKLLLTAVADSFDAGINCWKRQMIESNPALVSTVLATATRLFSSQKCELTKNVTWIRATV